MDNPDMMLKALRNEAIAKKPPHDPIDPTERIEPTEPIDKNEFLQPMHKNELVDAMLHCEEAVDGLGAIRYPHVLPLHGLA